MSASIFGAIPAVVIGGICILAVALLWAIWFPALRRAGDLTDVREPDVPDVTP
jgi:hypothetical protein